MGVTMRLKYRFCISLISLLFPQVSAWLSPLTAAEQRRRLKDRSSSLLASTPGRRSFVEGDTFDDPLDEIEALGGDAAFLDEKDRNEESNTDFLWDGEIDENAHLDLDLE